MKRRGPSEYLFEERRGPVAEDELFLIADQGRLAPLAEVLSDLAQISCASCGRSGIEHHRLDHVLVDLFEPPNGLN
jgi:hypothetical protein